MRKLEKSMQEEEIERIMCGRDLEIILTKIINLIPEDKDGSFAKSKLQRILNSSKGMHKSLMPLRFEAAFYTITEYLFGNSDFIEEDKEPIGVKILSIFYNATEEEIKKNFINPLKNNETQNKEFYSYDPSELDNISELSIVLGFKFGMAAGECMKKDLDLKYLKLKLNPKYYARLKREAKENCGIFDLKDLFHGLSIEADVKVFGALILYNN